MNEKLQEAERALSEFLTGQENGATMDEILSHFSGRIAESELRAAIWTLRAEGVLDFDDGKVRLTQTA